jgi:hypothetical protein
MHAGAFDSAGLGVCGLWKIYSAWGTPMEVVYKALADSSWKPVCDKTCDPDSQWKDPETAVCRRKALLAVLASSEVTVIEMTLVKSDSVRSVSESIELRLKDGDIARDPDRIIHWTVVDGSAARWLSLAPLNGSLHSAMSVAAIEATANSTGLGDTAMTGPFNTTLVFKSTAKLMTTNDFVDGTDTRKITVRLSIVAVPYVNEKHVTITRSSGNPVGQAEPIEAGEKLTVSITAFDSEGLPITRADLQLQLGFRGNLNNNHSTPLQLKADGTNATNVYSATIAETWVREPETVQSDASAFFRLPYCRRACSAAPLLRRPTPPAFGPFESISVPRPSLGRLVVSCSMSGATFDVIYSKELRIVQPSSKFIVLGATAGAIATLVLLAALYAPLDCLGARGGGTRCATLTRSAPPQVLVREAWHEGEGGAAFHRAARGEDGLEPFGGGLRFVGRRCGVPRHPGGCAGSRSQSERLSDCRAGVGLIFAVGGRLRRLAACSRVNLHRAAPPPPAGRFPHRRSHLIPGAARGKDRGRPAQDQSGPILLSSRSPFRWGKQLASVQGIGARRTFGT